MKIKSVTGILGSNCYLISSGDECAVIDPGAKFGEIMEMISEEACKLKYIILTHVHLDHIISVDELRESTKAPVLAHISEAGYLVDIWYNGAAFFGMDKKFKEADKFLEDGEILPLGDETLEIMHTPGHTPGSICIKCADNIFTGDTLFQSSVGRTDLGTGNGRDLEKSLKRLLEQPDDTLIYPGHGRSTNIGCEKKNNPFIV